MLRVLPMLPAQWTRRADIVIVGAGAAGLSAALAAANAGRSVLVISKGTLGTGSTPWAQGGLAAVLGSGDSFRLHAEDTRTSGAGLCDEGVVDELTASAPSEIESLIGLGAMFDVDATTRHLQLAREGGHSRHRVVHAGGDASGAEVSRALRVASENHPNIDFLEPAIALDLTGGGRSLLAAEIDENTLELRAGTISARCVILASGGSGQSYSATTNPRGSTGDGLALAARAGAAISDIEFVQFHPTVLWAESAGDTQRPLITEALRGDGAQLLDTHHRPFMADYHPSAELAPRDVVSAAMHDVMTAQSAEHLWLDATMISAGAWRDHFPTVFRICRTAGIDPRRTPIPVTPGAHYFCGGIRTDIDGRTSVPTLYAVGEVACTGVHGANRLASNSLTEALHFGRRAGLAAAGGNGGTATVTDAVAAGDLVLSSRTVDASATPAIRKAMSHHASVQRTAEGLSSLLDTLDLLPEGRHPRGAVTLHDVEAISLHTVATLVATAALLRSESRGCHRRLDYPQTSKRWQGHIRIGVTKAAGAHRKIPA